MTLGEKIAKQRKELNFTQEQLADTLGVSRQSVSKWELDIAYPETEKPIKMGKLFDCSMDYLLNEDIVEKQGTTPKTPGNIRNKFKKQFRERKSEKTVFGLLSSGFFSLGLLSIGGTVRRIAVARFDFDRRVLRRGSCGRLCCSRFVCGGGDKRGSYLFRRTFGRLFFVGSACYRQICCRRRSCTRYDCDR